MIAANIAAGLCSFKEGMYELDIGDHFDMNEILAVKSENERRASRAAEQNRGST